MKETRLLVRPIVRPLVRAAVGTLLTTGLFAACLSAPERALAAVTAANWDSPQQHRVLEAGLMANVGGSFAGAGRLSAAQAGAAIAALATRPRNSAGQSGANASSNARGSVSVVDFDTMLVKELGLRDVAAHVQSVAAAAGLRPPAYFGSETVARFLELRYEHPVGSEQLDLYPRDPITRAEAAWSLARTLSLGAWDISYAREVLAGFELPSIGADQRRALQIAVSRIGYPYVWGGTTDDTSDGLAHGGFDCSGFAWRVYKVSGLPWGQQIHGRTAAEQAGEIPTAERLRIGQLEPADLLFFGSARFNARATEKNVIHEGIYLGDNWVIHSSGQGVYVLPLEGGWLGSSFAWGRRVVS